MKGFYKILALLLIGNFAVGASARYKGDLNGDDRVDLSDMVFLAKAIKAGSTDKALDVNASGKVDDYDLHKLADIIISGNLIEDTGINVGIGGWDESGEDYGGAVRAPMTPTRSGEETEFYLRDPRYEDKDTYSIEFGIRYGDFHPYAILISLLATFDEIKGVRLDESVLKSHAIYGKPRKVTLKYNEDYTPECLRFIIFSSDLKKIDSPYLRLGRIWYYTEPKSYDDSPNFFNSQIIDSEGMDCVDLREHGSGFYGRLDVAVDELLADDAPCDILTADGILLKKSVAAWEINTLTHGLYIIRQDGKTIKFLK